MKKMNFGIIAVLGVFVIFLAGCQPEPTAKVETATAALESAKTAEADKYLVDEFTALQDTLTAVLANIEAEKAKPALSRNYRTIEEKLDTIIAGAEVLITNTETRKAEVRAQVSELLAVLTQSIEQAKEVVAKTTITARNRANIEAKQNEITVLEASVAEINTLVGSGDYLTALNKVNAANEKALALHAK